MFLGSWGVETDFLAQKINSSFNLLKDYSLVVPTLPITFAVKTDWPKTRVQIDDEINKAEREIEVLRVSAPDKINKIAIETSSELLEKLIGSGVNSSSISAIVDDLSKRNGDKYYGN